MITLTREEAQQVLDAMESVWVFVNSREKIKQPEGSEWYKGILGILRARLSAPEPEPVAWIDLQKAADQIIKEKVVYKRFIDGTPLANDIPCWMADFAEHYTTPPQRNWQGLTDDEIKTVWGSYFSRGLEFARAIEAKLREKNGGGA